MCFDNFSSAYDCLKRLDGVLYRGRANQTRYGKPCQAWASQSPHAHNVTADNITDASLDDANNYCRNAAVPNVADPTKVYKSSVWCYTTDINTRWDYCDVPSCKRKNIITLNYVHSTCSVIEIFYVPRNTTLYIEIQ